MVIKSIFMIIFLPSWHGYLYKTMKLYEIYGLTNAFNTCEMFA